MGESRGNALPSCLSVKEGRSAVSPTDPGDLARLAADVYWRRARQLTRLARTSRYPCDPGYWRTCAAEAEKVGQAWDVLRARSAPHQARRLLLHWLQRHGWHWWIEALESDCPADVLSVWQTR